MEACLPRSSENRLITLMPQFFFGHVVQEAIRDTTADAPMIRNAQELVTWIDKAQRALKNLQISVLDHAPRQLVPMDVKQLMQVAIALPEDGDDVPS
jgi:hypothetical protein